MLSAAWENSGTLCDSDHTQLVSLINGATAATDVAPARGYLRAGSCTPSAGGQQAVEAEVVSIQWHADENE